MSLYLPAQSTYCGPYQVGHGYSPGSLVTYNRLLYACLAPVPAARVLHHDAFDRTVSNGWGTARDGSTWTFGHYPFDTTDDHRAGFAVANGVGTITYGDDPDGTLPGSGSDWLVWGPPAPGAHTVDLLIRWSLTQADISARQPWLWEAVLNTQPHWIDGAPDVEIITDNNADGFRRRTTLFVYTPANSDGYDNAFETPAFVAGTEYWTRIRALDPFYATRTWVCTDPEPTTTWDASVTVDPPAAPTAHNVVLSYPNSNLSGQQLRFTEFTLQTARPTPDQDHDHWRVLRGGC